MITLLLLFLTIGSFYSIGNILASKEGPSPDRPTLNKAIEKERKRLAVDLHDSLGSELALLHIDIDKCDELSLQNRDLLRSRIHEIMTTLREQIFNIYPKCLQRGDLNGALKDYIIRVARQDNVRLMLEVSELDEQVLSNEQKIHLFRIVQELIHNSLKHSQASKAIISLSSDMNELKLQYEDDGCGLKSSKKTPHSVNERVTWLNGRIFVSSHAERNLRIVITIPLSTQNITFQNGYSI